MICPNCRLVGHAVTLQKRGGRVFDVEGAKSIHDMCKYPGSCTCQHVVTLNALNEGQPK